jgi:hypothetical protein
VTRYTKAGKLSRVADVAWRRRIWQESTVSYNWLRVLGTAELAQIDQRVCQQLHAIVPLLDTFKAEQQSLELVFPRKRPLDTHA